MRALIYLGFVSFLAAGLAGLKCDADSAAKYVDARIDDCPLTTPADVSAARTAFMSKKEISDIDGMLVSGYVSYYRPAESCNDYYRCYDHMMASSKDENGLGAKVIYNDPKLIKERDAPYWMAQTKIAFDKCKAAGVPIGKDGKPVITPAE